MEWKKQQQNKLTQGIRPKDSDVDWNDILLVQNQTRMVIREENKRAERKSKLGGIIPWLNCIKLKAKERKAIGYQGHQMSFCPSNFTKWEDTVYKLCNSILMWKHKFR